MYSLVIVIAAIAVLHFYFQQRSMRRPAYTLHLQGRTEEAEVMDFGVTLFDDETSDYWDEKINKAFAIAERRRAYNNKRMMDLMEQAQKAKEEAEKEKKLKASNG